MAFSASMMLADLDYIAPSQQCIKPMMKTQPATGNASGGLTLHQSGDQPMDKQEALKISLADCLACSGCVTTAETMLVTSQSKDEILTVMTDRWEAITGDKAERPVAPTTATPVASDAASNQATAVVDTSAIPSLKIVPTANGKPLFDVFCFSISDQSAASIAAALGISTVAAFRKVSGFARSVLGATHVVDTRWAQRVVLDATAEEFLRRLREEPDKLPLIVSSCPGWVCYCEKTKPQLLPYMCPVMSPQGVIGKYVKTVVAERVLSARRSAALASGEKEDVTFNHEALYHVSVQPCFDKKLEAVRPEFMDTTKYGRETDCVLSSHELLEWMREVDPTTPWDAGLDSGLDPLRGPEETSEATTLEGSGGFHQHVMRYAANKLGSSGSNTSNAFPLSEIKYQTKRNANNRLATHPSGALTHPTTGRQLIFGIAYGFQTIQNIVRMFGKASAPQYSFIEIMACPEGCLNGGGQVRPSDPTKHRETLAAVCSNFEEFTEGTSGGGSQQHSQHHKAQRTEPGEFAAEQEGKTTSVVDPLFTEDSVYRDMLQSAKATKESAQGLSTVYHNRAKEMEEAQEVNLATLKW